MQRGHNGGYNDQRDSHGRFAPHPAATEVHQPIALRGDEITLGPEDDRILDAIWGQIARESSPSQRMNTAIRSRARRLPAAPSKEPI